jgi:flagellar hook protein FlgE
MSGILQSLYNSMSGLFSFSNSLETISNNISNMNTPGYRGSSSFFENLMDGTGTKIAGTGTNLSEGQIAQTSTTTDVAINGEGLFILKDGQGNTYYTRSGQFQFNASGILVDSVNQYFVQGYDPSGALGNINITSFKTLPAQATTAANMVGNIDPSSPTASVSAVTIFDAQGTSHALSVTLTNNITTTPGSWLVAVTDSTGASVGTGEVRFDTSGTLQAGYNTVTVSTSLGAAQPIALKFGTAGGLSGTTSFAGSPTNLSASVADGHAVVGVSSQLFDTNGTLQLKYADGETKAGPQLALASFSDESSLHMIKGNLYLPPQNQVAQVGRPNTTTLGQIQGGSLEMSNVDLTQELADMIVIQRGYQASSRVMTVSNEMLQQLYDSVRGQ